MLFPWAARFAAHLAFIVAASCARRSGDRFSFLFAFFALLGFFVSTVCAENFLPADLVARAADFLAAFNACADSACCNLRLSFASFCGPSRKRFSSCWIFFFNFFGFIIVSPPHAKGELTMAFQLMTKFRRCHAILWPDFLILSLRSGSNIGSSRSNLPGRVNSGSEPWLRGQRAFSVFP